MTRQQQQAQGPSSLPLSPSVVTLKLAGSGLQMSLCSMTDAVMLTLQSVHVKLDGHS